MNTDQKKLKVVVIVGPTASGKTSLSIKIAKHFAGEVISADSRQVYRGMDLGTGKVTTAEMHDVPHHLLDVADPTTVYTVSDFVKESNTAINEIIGRGHLPIIVGGTFLYVDTLLGRISTPAVPPNPTLRQELEKKTKEELFAILEKLDMDRASTIDRHNPRRLVRAIEIATSLGHVPETSPTTPYNALILGIDVDKTKLHENIHIRLIERLEQGMVKEVEKLLKEGVSHERLEDLGLEYRYISRYLRSELSYDNMVVELETKTKQFAKRQMTWLKRDQEIVWVNPRNFEPIKHHIDTFLFA